MSSSLGIWISILVECLLAATFTLPGLYTKSTITSCRYQHGNGFFSFDYMSSPTPHDESLYCLPKTYTSK